MTQRVGMGFDAHRLVSGRRLVLGGVEIAHPKGLTGHSDADVLVHAVCDALLGAAAIGDIGRHFPDSDERYRGISSLMFLSETARMLREEGYTILNVDTTVAAETPKLSPYYEEMRQSMADAMEVEMAIVSVKATTTEGLGYTGRGEGIAAWAVALINKR
ncbi:MAG: 2-C-methyl-D-erythritol 2,4-cyclodiphosphate synthase [Nitrospinota bacterium]|nr:2-C-methyl-D-erythritol 2,4-cyclodiphosphate synthase [Nitrospinota bacterium]